MDPNPTDRLLALLADSGRSYQLLDHAECRTSEQSAAARASAGAPDAVGAKALIVKIEKGGEFVMCVLPGVARLDGKSLRKLVGGHRFATAEEVGLATNGLQPGMVPPFGKLVFPNVARLLVATSLREYHQVGFNAACLTRSIVMNTDDYLAICGADAMVELAVK